jgi:enoyl-CoA hydratase/carnithine racemase
VNGLGVGFGLTVLPWCDIVLMAPTAKLKAPFVELGVVTEAAASVSLVETMGPQAASWYLLTGEWITAEAALAHGLALRIVEGEQLLDEAVAIATRFAEQPPKALRATTGLIRQRRGDSWSDAVQREYDLMAELAGGDENIAAITKFFEKG